MILAVLFRPFGFIVPKDFTNIWFSSLSNIPDEGFPFNVIFVFIFTIARKTRSRRQKWETWTYWKNRRKRVERYVLD